MRGEWRRGKGKRKEIKETMNLLELGHLTKQANKQQHIMLTLRTEFLHRGFASCSKDHYQPLSEPFLSKGLVAHHKLTSCWMLLALALQLLGSWPPRLLVGDLTPHPPQPPNLIVS